MTKQPQDKATARPWMIFGHDQVRGSDGSFVADSCTTFPRKETNDANTALIVEAVNNHDRLQAQNRALREALETCEKRLFMIDKGVAEIARAALAQS